MNSLSKIFKASRVILDENAFVLKNKEEVIENHNAQERDTDPDFSDLSNERRPDDSVEQAKQEAEAILEEADAEADLKLKNAEMSSESIISDAYDQAKGIMERAKQDGYKDGFDSGLAESQKVGNEIIEQAETIKQAWLTEREAVFKSAEKEMIDLVLEVVEKLLNHHVETDVSLIESLIKMGIQRVSRTEQLTIRVSTDDYNQAISVKPIILAMSDKIDAIEIKRDPSLQNGSCMIDADSGSVDSGIWTQFEEVTKLFEEMLKGE